MQKLNMRIGMTFRTRIRISFTVLIAFSVLVTGSITYFFAANILEHNAIKSRQELLYKSKQLLDDKLRQVTVSVMSIMISNEFKDMLNDVSLGVSEHYPKHFTLLQTIFTQMKLNEPAIQGVLISTPMGEFYPTNLVRSSDSPFINSPIHKRLLDYGGTVWIENHVDPFFSNHEQVISLVMNPLAEVQVNDVSILVNIKANVLRDSLMENIEDADETIVLLDLDNTEVLHVGSPFIKFDAEAFAHLINEEESGFFEYKMNNEDYLVQYARLTLSENWILVNLQSKASLFKQMNQIKIIVIVVMAACLGMALLFSRMLMRSLLKPLVNLQSLMRRVELNDLSVRFVNTQKRMDEFTVFGLRFNRMLEEIENLIQAKQEVEKEKSKSDLKALQDQVVPHFLYNTLNTIYWKSQMNQKEQVGEMIIALSQLFKLGLNNGDEITTINNEVMYVRQYLHLQQQCYEDLFSYDIKVQDEQLLHKPILKLLLQPLVENSILHGFKDMDTGGHIRITIEEADDGLQCTVSDNGEGMDAEHIMEMVTQPTSITDSYALRNVYHRIKLYYGEFAKMNITSKPHHQTTVQFYIPYGKDN